MDEDIRDDKTPSGQLSIERIELLCESIQNNTSSETHEISYHKHLELKFIEMLSKSLEKNISIKKLVFQHNDATDEFFICLLTALSKNAVLTHMDFSFNNISSTGIKFFADLLEKNTTWNWVSFWQNTQINDESVGYLAKALEKNTALASLNLAGTAITSQGAQQFVSVLKKNFSLTRLWFGQNESIEAKTIEDINYLLKKNLSLNLYLAMVFFLKAEILPDEIIQYIFSFLIYAGSDSNVKNLSEISQSPSSFFYQKARNKLNEISIAKSQTQEINARNALTTLSNI